MAGRRQARAVAKCRYRLMAVDLDGTLLDASGEPHEKDLTALRDLKARGVVVTILTGRLFSGTRKAANAIGIDGPVGCADGSHVVHVKDERTLLHHGIRGKTATRLRAALMRHDLAAFLFSGDYIVHDRRGEEYLQYVRTWSTDIEHAESLTDHPLWDAAEGMTAVVALGRETNIGRAVADIHRDGEAGVQVATFPVRRGHDAWGMVARATGGTKATALEFIARQHGIPLSETVCVGDWLNDVPMLRGAGRSFAMGQAPPEVKAAATDVLEETSAKGGGVASAIARAFGL